MSVIVTDAGFSTNTLSDVYLSIDQLPVNDEAGLSAVDLLPGDDPSRLAEHLCKIGLIRIDFPSFDDGRGFTLARKLRLMDYSGRLRAKGHVIAEQYTMARRAGFDEIEISDDLASRQPEQQWQARADWTANDYQSKLRGVCVTSL